MHHLSITRKQWARAAVESIAFIPEIKKPGSKRRKAKKRKRATHE